MSYSTAAQRLFFPLLIVVLCAGILPAQERRRDRSKVHDPSTIVKCGSEYWFFSTGWGVTSWRSKDLVNWERGSQALAKPPSWTSQAIPGNRGYFWAPDIIHLDGRYLLYYSVSTWGKNTSAIGLASSPTLDPNDPRFGWTDQGIAIQSSPSNNFNAIDPAVYLDPNGRLWLSFGSFWSGIKLVELNPSTGKRLNPDSPIHSLAYHSEIEAPCIIAHGGYYYLFVNWGLCCRRTNSTYEIRVGRSKSVTGPYLDREGKDLAKEGGNLFLYTEDRFIGPGHAAVLQDGNVTWLSYHFYDAERAGSSRLAIRHLQWDKDGWPVAGAYLTPPDTQS